VAESVAAIQHLHLVDHDLVARLDPETTAQAEVVFHYLLMEQWMLGLLETALYCFVQLEAQVETRGLQKDLDSKLFGAGMPRCLSRPGSPWGSNWPKDHLLPFSKA